MEEYVQAVIRGPERGGEGCVQLGLGAVEGAGEVGEIDGLALRREVAPGFQEHVDGPEHRPDTRMGEDAEVFVVVHAHGRFHDKAGDGPGLLEVGVDAGKARGHGRDAAGVGGV